MLASKVIEHIGYRNFEKISFNHSASVNIATDPNGNKVLLKRFHNNGLVTFVKHPDFNSDIPNELYIMKKLEGQTFIPKIIDYHQKGPWHTVVMEYLDVESGWVTLQQMKKDEIIIKEIIKKYITIIDKLAKIGVHYLDVKTDNIMVNVHDLEVKLIDFQDAFYSKKENPTSKSKFGTAGYMCPASRYGKLYNLKERQAYAIGALTYVSIESLYVDSNVIKSPKNHVLEFKLSSDNAKSFVLACTEYTPKYRIAYKDLLNHSWFSN